MCSAVCSEEHAVTADCWESRKDSCRELAETVIAGSKDGYPELEEKKEFILKVISKEEEQFNKTIDQGLGILSDMIGKMEAEGAKTLGGEDAFRLYDTYGFPAGSDERDPGGEGNGRG